MQRWMIRDMKLAHTWLLGVPLLVGSMVLAHAAFVPHVTAEPVQVNRVDDARCDAGAMQPGLIPVAAVADRPECRQQLDP